MSRTQTTGLTKDDAKTLRLFVGKSQMAALLHCLKGEESAYYAELLAKYAERMRTMPRTYEQDGKGEEAMVYLHYFNAGYDWYITEADIGDGGRCVELGPQDQAFGLACVNESELGYISIAELIANGVELDLHFEPCTLASLRATLDPE